MSRDTVYCSDHAALKVQQQLVLQPYDHLLLLSLHTPLTMCTVLFQLNKNYCTFWEQKLLRYNIYECIQYAYNPIFFNYIELVSPIVKAGKCPKDLYQHIISSNSMNYTSLQCQATLLLLHPKICINYTVLHLQCNVDVNVSNTLI